MPAAQTQTRSIEEVREDIARNLKAYRMMRGLAQEALALEADVDRTMVSKIERGVTNPSIATLLKLANRLEIRLSDLLHEH
ncbi:MAG: helix-turn-helix transcriptional regulator [Rhodocyclaceae bacterium]|nr:helix-turn-helix transcriptional regulator [Rhodocyclaceae bacterium]